MHSRKDFVWASAAHLLVWVDVTRHGYQSLAKCTYSSLGMQLTDEGCSEMLAWADLVLQDEP